MKLTRREIVKLGAAAGAAAAIDPRALVGRGVLSGRIEGPRTRPIPSTGERIPVVGIGTARRYDVGTSEAERQPLQNTLEVFRELGGTVVDTAPSYGNAETVVGDLVHELGIRDELFFSTKVRTEGRDEGLAEIDRSFARLQTDTSTCSRCTT